MLEVVLLLVFLQQRLQAFILFLELLSSAGTTHPLNVPFVIFVYLLTAKYSIFLVQVKEYRPYTRNEKGRPLP